MKLLFRSIYNIPMYVVYIICKCENEIFDTKDPGNHFAFVSHAGFFFNR